MDHEVRMTTPGIGKQDVVFEVVIDGEKGGEPNLSQGDGRWRPRSSRTDFRFATWAEFAEWLES